MQTPEELPILQIGIHPDIFTSDIAELNWLEKAIEYGNRVAIAIAEMYPALSLNEEQLVAEIPGFPTRNEVLEKVTSQANVAYNMIQWLRQNVVVILHQQEIRAYEYVNPHTFQEPDATLQLRIWLEEVQKSYGHDRSEKPAVPSSVLQFWATRIEPKSITELDPMGG